MKVLLAAALALAVPAAVAGLGAGRPLMPLIEDETKIGAGVTLTEATPIAALIKTPQDYTGKKVRIDGVATAVCAAMGCWMAVADSHDKDAPTVRLKVEHEGAIVFPMSAKGRKVSAEGRFEAIGKGDEHANEAAAEHAQHDKNASKQYQITATGAVVR
jgi:hypothetical protein